MIRPSTGPTAITNTSTRWRHKAGTADSGKGECPSTPGHGFQPPGNRDIEEVATSDLKEEIAVIGPNTVLK